MRYLEENNSAFGHIANGGGATISNSPINITINININEGTQIEDDQGRLTDAGKALSFLERILRRGNDRRPENEPVLVGIDAVYSRLEGGSWGGINHDR